MSINFINVKCHRIFSETECCVSSLIDVQLASVLVKSLKQNFGEMVAWDWGNKERTDEKSITGDAHKEEMHSR